jgi:phosphonate transport system permease protein
MNTHTFRRYLFDSTSYAYLIAIIAVKFLQPTEEDFFKNIYGYFVQFLMAVGIGIFFSYVLNVSGVKTFGEVLFEPPYKKAENQDGALFKSFWGWHFLVFFFVTIWIGFEVTHFSFVELMDEQGFSGAQNLFKGLATPNWTILPSAVLNIIQTIFMAFIATILAIPIAFVLCFLCAKNIMKHPVAKVFYLAFRTLFNVTRSIEALIWAIIFSVWVGIGPFAGMLALMIHSIASLAKQYSEMVESVSEGPIEGILSTGAGPFQVIWFAIVPQVILPFISFTVYRWDTNVRMATIIGLVGGGGIGNLLIKYQGQAMWNEVGTIVIVIAVVVWSMDQASAVIRDALK